MNVGDVVRVTSKTNTPDAAVEGTVTFIDDHPRAGHHVTVSMLWGNPVIVSTDHFNVEVLRAVEPKELGSIIQDKMGYKYTRYTEKSFIDKPWVSETGGFYDWNDLRL